MKYRRERFVDSSGFSLIELIIAIAIFSIGILAISLMQAKAIQGNHQANNMTLAVTVMSDHIERLMNESYASSDLTVGTHNSTAIMPAGVQSCSWTVTEWGSDGSDNDSDGLTDEADEQDIKAIDVTVNYRIKGVVKNISATFMKINQ